MPETDKKKKKKSKEATSAKKAAKSWSSDGADYAIQPSSETPKLDTSNWPLSPGTAIPWGLALLSSPNGEWPAELLSSCCYVTSLAARPFLGGGKTHPHFLIFGTNHRDFGTLAPTFSQVGH
jgi:hypothetical protein